MRLTLRLSLLLILGVATVSLAFAFYQTRAETLGLKNDLDHQSRYLVESLSRSAEPLVARRAFRELQTLVNRFENRERIAGVAIFDTNRNTLAISAGLAPRISHDQDALQKTLNRTFDNNLTNSDFVRAHDDAGKLHIAATPLRDESNPLAPLLGAIAVFHDTTYIDAQIDELWQRALIGVAIQTFLIGSITLLMIRWGVGRPMQRMAQWMRELRTAGDEAPEPPHPLPERSEFAPLTREVTRLASSLSAARAAAEQEARLRETAEATWTNERLRAFVNSKLNGERLVAISNREPYEHFHRGQGIEAAMPASGLVTALEPILSACRGTWIAQATGDADRETVDAQDHVQVPPDHPNYTLRRVWLSQEQQHGFYFGFANEGLWPLCHIAHTRPAFRAEDWEHYVAVNRKFADVALEEIASEANPIVLAQDYHFALLPRMIKEKRPDARVAIFWHIPWPNPEAFGICPWQRELLDGLLGADLIGFHIQAHCNNFLETVDRVLEARIDWEHFSVQREGRDTLVKPFPISVASCGIAAAANGNGNGTRAATIMERPDLLARHGVRAECMGIGVDRVDYTKGIPERFQAIERFFEKYPAYRGKFTHVQIGSPSRSEIKRYHDLMEEVTREAERINKRFQTSDWKPIVMLTRQHSHSEILPYYRAADVCLVTSLHDGMNLVAKEFVAARKDEQGVLILSRFAGAAHELADALIVNPYDIEQLADEIHRALEMSPEQRRTRMRKMRAQIRDHNIYRWAGDLIGELYQIRPSRTAPPAPAGPPPADSQLLAVP